MITHLTSIEQIRVVDDVICDSCDKSCLSHTWNVGDYKEFDFMTINAMWGFHSHHDGERWIAHICETCAVDKFKFVNFQKTDYINGGEIENI